MFTKNIVFSSSFLKKFLVAALSLTTVSLLFSVLINAQSSDTTTFYPEPISFSDPDITNPSRGYYKWQGQQRIPSQPTYDEYRRYRWRDLEPTINQYNFSQIDADIAAAAQAGRRYSFRIQSMLGYDNNSSYADQLFVPDYLSTCGWWADYDGDPSDKTFIPDWNNQCYLDRVQQLLQALGLKYNQDPRVSWVDIGLYGQYGEWSLSSNINYTQAPSGITPATDATRYAIIDYHIDAFSNKQLVTFLLQKNLQFILYAFNHPNAQQIPIGWRVDCIGQPTFFNQWVHHPEDWQQVSSRWQVAPAIGEFCYTRHNDPYPPPDGVNNPNPYHALQQVQTYHISLVGNGNMDAWSTFSTQEQADFTTLGKILGYRLLLNSVTVPSLLTTGQSAVFSSSWSNHSVAPLYEPYQVAFQLYGSDPQPVWQSTSTFQPASLLPTLNNDTDNPLTVTDTFQLPGDLAAGNYQLRISITDPRGLLAPLALANQGRQLDGSYLLGPISVNSSSPTATPTIILPSPTSVPSSTPTPTSTPTQPPPTPTLTPTPQPIVITYPVSSYSVTTGSRSSGNLTSLIKDDNKYLAIKSTTKGSPRWTSTTFNFQNISNPAQLKSLVSTVRLKSSTSNTAVIFEFFNYSTNTWQQFSSTTISTSEITRTVTVPSNFSQYVSSLGQTRLRVSSSKSTSSTYTLQYEFVQLTVTR